jgi:hypothetical protein
MRHGFIGFLLLGVASPLFADGHEETGKHGTTVVTLRLDSTTVPLSGHINLTFVVEGPAPLNVELPEPLTEPKDLWSRRELMPVRTAALPEKRMRWTRTVRLEPLSHQEIPLQIGPLRFRAGPSESWSEQTWKPITVRVTTSVEEASLKAVRDITPIEQLPEPPDWRPSGIVLGSVGAAIALAAFLVWKLRRPPVPPPEPTPQEWALKELARIDALDLPAAQEVERFHVLVSDVLRQFLERRFGLHVTEQTTPEFLADLRRSALLAPEQQELLREFLRQCDLAKFARAEFTPVECQALLGTARDFIQQRVKQPHG